MQHLRRLWNGRWAIVLAAMMMLAPLFGLTSSVVQAAPAPTDASTVQLFAVSIDPIAITGDVDVGFVTFFEDATSLSAAMASSADAVAIFFGTGAGGMPAIVVETAPLGSDLTAVVVLPISAFATEQAVDTDVLRAFGTGVTLNCNALAIESGTTRVT